MGPSAVKFCMMVHIGPEEVVFPFGKIPWVPLIQNFGPKLCQFQREYP